jgi:hypothetical protein
MCDSGAVESAADGASVQMNNPTNTSERTLPLFTIAPEPECLRNL